VSSPAILTGELFDFLCGFNQFLLARECFLEEIQPYVSSIPLSTEASKDFLNNFYTQLIVLITTVNTHIIVVIILTQKILSL
jgi:hypothetical protein